MPARGGAFLGSVALVVALLVASVLPVAAGTVDTTVEAATVPALSVAVSRHAFADGSADDVVVVPDDRPALLAVAATLAGATLRRAPVLVTGAGARPSAVVDEAERVTGGGDDRDPPVAWLLGADDPGLGDGWDVHHLA